MSVQEIDEYLQGLEEPKQSALEAVRRAILEVTPRRRAVISYSIPAFRVDGKIVAGFGSSASVRWRHG